MGKYSEAVCIIVAIVVVCASSLGAVGDDTLSRQCSDAFQKLPICLAFATGKEAQPSKDCCTSVASIKSSKPACLCFIIQQFYIGNTQLKSFGIQEAKLLQLSSACKLTNASMADCPKILNIPANSPDAAIFKDPGSSAAATSAAPKGTSLPVTADNSPEGTSNNVAQLAIESLKISIIGAAIFVCALFQ